MIKKYFTDEERNSAKIETTKRYQTTLKGSTRLLINSYNQSDEKYGRGKGDLDVEWVMEQRLKGCTYKDICGTTDWRKVGLNRKDNSLPHTKTNCEPCCFECNRRLQGRTKKKIQIDQIDKITGEVIASFPSLDAASKAVKGCSINILRCCNGGYYRKNVWHKSNSSYGYKWKQRA